MLSLINDKNVEETETTRGQQIILVSDKRGRAESYRAFAVACVAVLQKTLLSSGGKE